MVLLDPILNPLLELNPLVALIIISGIIALFMTIIYKWMTDQELMKVLKADMKKFQKEMKELREHPDKMIEAQKKAMETNMKYMKQSFKPTLVTLLPVLLIFGWLNAHLAFMPIVPAQEFGTYVEFQEGASGSIEIIPPEGFKLLSGKVVDIKNSRAFWKLKGPTGRHMIEYNYNNITYNKNVLITNTQNYEEPVKEIDKNNIKTINIDNKPMKPLNIFGWEIGWLGTYIIFSIIFSMTLRKILKLH